MTEMFAGSSPEAMDLLLRRRSTSAKGMGEPGPDAAQLRKILQAASRTPDHGKLFPWRFIVFQGEARAKFGEVLEAALVARNADVGEGLRRLERGRFLRAPVVVAVISSLKSEKPIPEWEQRLSAGAVCQNMLLACAALGFGANWITEWYAYDDAVRTALGLAQSEQVAGFIYVGTGVEPLAERDRPELDQIVSAWRPAA
jgi:nitroreductase